jgi:hypothetical protein
MEGLAWEDEYSPVVRLELARRLMKGFISGRIPGTFADSFFRHRNGGKTFLMMADPKDKEGRIDLANWGDNIEYTLKIGFRVQRNGGWLGMEAFTHQDAADSPLTAEQARSARWWNESPVVASRHYAATNTTVNFKGRYWFSDEDRLLEYGFTAGNAERLQVVVGEPGKPIPLLGNPAVPTTLHLPDRKTKFQSNTDGDKVFAHPAFRYLILSKPGDAGIAVGYSKALLVIWDGAPERVEVLSADKGYGEVRVTYAGPSGKVWLYPYTHFDNRDSEALFRSAEQFLAKGTLLQNGYPPAIHQRHSGGNGRRRVSPHPLQRPDGLHCPRQCRAAGGPGFRRRGRRTETGPGIFQRESSGVDGQDGARTRQRRRGCALHGSGGSRHVAHVFARRVV